MAIINKIENVASITYNGTTIRSLPTETLLLVLPTVIKTVDKAIASIGETLNYTVVIGNIGLTAIKNLEFRDSIPRGSEYVVNSFKVNGAAVTPTIETDTLKYTIPNIAALGSATIEFQVHVIGGTV